MKGHTFSKWEPYLLAAFLFTFITAPLASAEEAETRTVYIKGVAVTGPNDLCGQPIWSMPAPLPATIHGTSVGQF
jgi:hypothetical protein